MVLRTMMHHAVQEWEAVVLINRFIVVEICTLSFYAVICLNMTSMLKQVRSVRSKYSLSQEILCLLSKPFRCALSTVISSFFKINLGLPSRHRFSGHLDTGFSGHLNTVFSGHLDTGFSWFPCVYKQMLRWFPTFQVATTCFSCSPPDLNLVLTNFMFCLHVK